MPDPVARNRRITACYHALSAATASRVSPGANWCTFAAWASRQAGQTIRGEDLARVADELLGAPEVRARLEHAARVASVVVGGPLVAALRAEVEGVLRSSAAAVAVGNRKVFAEIGREFARWLAMDPLDTAAFVAGLRDGEPPDGQRMLREAFVAYGDAIAAADPKARAERLLLANLLVGRHEQTRLQPEIAAALNSALDRDRVRDTLLALLLPGAWRRARARVARALGRPLPLDVAIDALVDAVQRALRVALTETVMTLRLPGTVLRLGRDVPGAYPAELQLVEYAPLGALLAQVDPRPGGPWGSGAADWASLTQRMHFIAELFRCWHGRAELFGAPE